MSQMSPIITANPAVIEPLKEALRKNGGHQITVALTKANTWQITCPAELTPMKARGLENFIHGFVLGWEAKGD